MLTFSIVTPSYKNLNWLKLCAASVRDQGVQLEHIVQDAGSPDGTPEWLDCQEGVCGFVEKDQGMYDAVNRGFRRATGDVLAYLNCDEQYLPGALSKVQDFFARNPKVEMVFADALVVDPSGEYLCERRSSLPQAWHTMVSNNLSVLTAATFFRRSVFHQRGLAFDPSLRSVGDAEWILRVLSAGVKMAVLPELTSSFTDTGANLNTRPELQSEKDDLMHRAPRWAQRCRGLIVAHYRLRRLLAGHYWPRQPYSYSIYTLANPTRRSEFRVLQPRFRWERTVLPVETMQPVAEGVALALPQRGGLEPVARETGTVGRLAP